MEQLTINCQEIVEYAVNQKDGQRVEKMGYNLIQLIIHKRNERD